MNSPLSSPLSSLPVDQPVLAAPMAGGPTTPALVIAAARAGSMGFLAAGYKTPASWPTDRRGPRADRDLRRQLVRAQPGAGRPGRVRRYADALQAEADRYGLRLAGAASRADDDGWPDKLDLLLADPVPVVSFTFGLPAPSVSRRFARPGR